LTGARPATVRTFYWIVEHWFDIGDVYRVNALSELCPCANRTENRALTFDRSIADDVQRPPFVNARTVQICGNFQSWKYASAIGDELRQRLRWKPHVTAAVSG